MPVYHRFFEAGHLQFITTSTYRRVAAFSHPDYCTPFVNVLREARAKFRFLLIGWVLMPEHFHLLLQPWPAESTSDLVKDIKQRSANSILKALQATSDVARSRSLLRSFHLPPTVHDHAHYRVWQRRFFPFNVYTEKKCHEKLEYMHSNPVKRRLVAAPGALRRPLPGRAALMRSIHNFTFALVICMAAPWLRAQSNGAVVGTQSDAIMVQTPAPRPPSGGSLAPVKAIVTAGETAELIANSTLTFTTIDVPGAGFTSVQSVNTAGEMAGIYASTGLSPDHGFSLSGGNFTFIDYLGAEATRAWGINDSGLIVGQAEFQNDTVWLGFEYDGTTFTPIRDGKDSATVCLGLNNASWVVGGDGTVYTTKGFELRGRTFKTIAPPGNYVYVYATGINKFGEVVGYNDGIYSYYVGFSYINGKYETIDFPGEGETTTEPWGINDRGVIVGWYNPMSAYDYGFVLRNGKYISFSYPGAVQTAAYGINSNGQIVGTYSLDNETYHGFVTSPLTLADFPPDQ